MCDNKNSTAVDGGFWSRKLLFALFSSIMILAASKICPGAGLGEVVVGLVSVCSLYLGANTVVKWRAADIEKAKNELPGMLGKMVDKAVEIADKKEDAEDKDKND
jgi:hypothetical protein